MNLSVSKLVTGSNPLPLLKIRGLTNHFWQFYQKNDSN